MKKTFLEFLSLQENTESKKAQTEVKLSDDSDYKPFDVTKHPNLRVLVKAFLESPQVSYPGPDGASKMRIMDKSKGETEPKLGKKGLYLVGGAVRDHLLGKTPKDYDLATDAHPDEIKLILKNAGFVATDPQTSTGTKDKDKSTLPPPGNKSKVYYVKGTDRSPEKKEFVIGARVNGEEFEIATFRKDAKSDGRKVAVEFSGLDDDAARRDFTINSMYIPLTTADGPNSKLIDPHGGVHHLRSKEIHWIGNAKDRLEEDQLRALRFIRQVQSHGQNTKVTDEIKQAFDDIKELPAVSRERIRDEFLKGLTHRDVDVVKYVKMFKDLGMLATVFPDLQFKLDVPEDYSEKKEPRLAVAWLLRNNSPNKVREVLKGTAWQSKEVEHIVHLIELANWMKLHGQSPELFFDKFYDMKKRFHQITPTEKDDGGTEPVMPLSVTMAKEWGKMNKLPEDVMHKFLTHRMDPKNPSAFKTKGYVDTSLGGKQINPEIIKRLGGPPKTGEDWTRAIKGKETEDFMNSLGHENEEQ
jgi:tRNA nucleotidyltransferase/poly(A) polymerase